MRAGPGDPPGGDPAYLDAGYDHVYLHQVGPDQPGFIDFAARELMPALGVRQAVTA